MIAIEERSGVHFVPSARAHFSWTSQGLQRFFNLVGYLKDRFAIVIIDLPPILGLAETIRLGMAADSVAMVIRWGRTERRFVQFALDALRGANVSAIAVILNDIDLKVQQRRGYRDHTVVYTDKGLYRAGPGYRDQEPAARTPLPMTATDSDAYSESRPKGGDTPRDRPRTAGSDIEELYNRYHD